MRDEVDPVEVRRRIGMVFQRPNPTFPPTMSIADNTVAGLRLQRARCHVREYIERG